VDRAQIASAAWRHRRPSGSGDRRRYWSDRAQARSGPRGRVYEWGDHAVIKLYRPGYLGHRAEAVALARLDGHSVAPRLIDIVDRGGRTGLVLERLGGSDVLALLQRRPWRVLDLARALAKAHLAVHDVQAPDVLPDLRQVLAARIDDAVLPVQLRAFAMRVLDGLPTVHARLAEPKGELLVEAVKASDIGENHDTRRAFGAGGRDERGEVTPINGLESDPSSTRAARSWRNRRPRRGSVAHWGSSHDHVRRCRILSPHHVPLARGNLRCPAAAPSATGSKPGESGSYHSGAVLKRASTPSTVATKPASSARSTPPKSCLAPCR
jgi:hypothetical protein